MQWNGTSFIAPTGESRPLFASGDHAHNSVKGHTLPCIIHAIDVISTIASQKFFFRVSSSDPIP